MNKRHKGTKSDSTDSLLFTIEKPIELLPFLLEVMPSRGRNSVKSILARGQVKVDDYIITKYNHALHQGQKVTILKNKAAIAEGGLIGLSILHEDNDIIVINKDAGLLSIATTKEKKLTAHNKLMEYARNKGPQNRVFVVHRLDKDTSGVMVFAKSERVKQILQNNWNEVVKFREYIALVEGKMEKEKGYISSWLRETKTHIVYSSKEKNDGLHAMTHYRTMQSNNNYSLMEVRLETGRKNQIRVHMQDLGHPVVGDKKYGSKMNPINRLGLHSHRLSFIHPTSKKVVDYKVDAPRLFYVKSR